jgi:hypothetical protein
MPSWARIPQHFMQPEGVPSTPPLVSLSYEYVFSHKITFRSILHLCKIFPLKPLSYVWSHMRATCLTHCILFDFDFLVVWALFLGRSRDVGGIDMSETPATSILGIEMLRWIVRYVSHIIYLVTVQEQCYNKQFITVKSTIIIITRRNVLFSK